MGRGRDGHAPLRESLFKKSPPETPREPGVSFQLTHPCAHILLDARTQRLVHCGMRRLIHWFIDPFIHLIIDSFEAIGSMNQ
jgi:hypothetical protein